MQHIIFKEADSYKAAILIKPSQLLETDLRRYYLTKLIAKGVSQDQIIALSVRTNPTGKVTATIAKEYLNKALKAIHNLGITTLFVCDSTYFKVLTKKAKTEPHYGYVVPCAIAGYEHMNIVLGVNYQAIYYNPKLQDSLDLGLATLANKMLGVYTPVGSSIIRTANYPESTHDIAIALAALHEHPVLTCDIETFSLDFWKAGIGTIAFAWNKNEGTAFTVDYKVIPDANTPGLTYANEIDNVHVKRLLREFFDTYEGIVIYHNGNFDIKILVYELWMYGDFFATEEMLQGIEVLTKNTEDTKLIAYLATNATVGNNLKLKSIAQAFAGNYAQEDITDIRLIARDSLLEYNLVDCLSTWYAFDKYYQTMCDEGQLEVYRNIMLPSISLILQMELTGMPLNMETVTKTEATLLRVQRGATDELTKSTVLQSFSHQLQKEEMVLKNLLLKVKVKPIEDFHHIQFNAKSNKHLRNLLYTYLGYDVVDVTKTGLPATGAKTLKKLLIKAKCKEHESIFNALIELAEVSILLNTFINAFKNKAVAKSNGRWYLHGNFNIGGTVSGRLSSSKPNMQNIPSTGTKYAKSIKECFSAPDGWIMVGADFSSLEDRISALTTKDPNKLKVYEGHTIYELIIDGACHHIRDDATICYEGKSYTGEEFYETYSTL